MENLSMAKPLFFSITLFFFFIMLLPRYNSADPDPLQDFCIADLTSDITLNGFPCKPVSTVTSSDFFSSTLGKRGDTNNPNGSNATVMDAAVFPGLNTQGVSMNRIDFAPKGVNPPHVHPRGSELGLVAEGELLVGIISTQNVFYSKVLKAGESFVIPRGVIHFQYNVGKGNATQFVAFNSQNPGIAFAPVTIFGSKPEIPTEVLTKAFRVGPEIIDILKSKFQDNDSELKLFRSA